MRILRHFLRTHANPVRHGVCLTLWDSLANAARKSRSTLNLSWRPNLLGVRFSLKSLLGATTFVSIALASLLHPWRSWGPATVLTSLVLLLLLSIPAAIYARGRVRAFYVGFATVGWGYFFLTYAPWFETNVSRLLLADRVAESACFAVTGSLGESLYFLRVTHALSIFAQAYLGGLIASRFYLKNIEQSDAEKRHDTDVLGSGQDLRDNSKKLSLRKAE